MYPGEELAALSAYLRDRRDAIVEAWRRAVTRDPNLTTSATLPRAQLIDHIPVLLESYERKLVPEKKQRETAPPHDPEASAAAHGLHRWQQGFDLAEVTRELGRLNECMIDELERYAVEHPSLRPEVPSSLDWSSCTI